MLNVWQYDEQVFDFADGRLLLRGANGAGKSKTMEMLLPFVLDGDKARLTASGRHHTSLLWLMLDGYDGQARTGYLWVEFGRRPGRRVETHVRRGHPGDAVRAGRDGVVLHVTAPGRHRPRPGGRRRPARRRARSRPSSRTAAGTSSTPRGATASTSAGCCSASARPVRRAAAAALLAAAAAGRRGHRPGAAGRAARQGPPQRRRRHGRAAGDTFDELEAFGEQIERRARSAESLTAFAETYAGYARSVVAVRGRTALAATKEVRDARRALTRAGDELGQAQAELAVARADHEDAEEARAGALARIAALETSPEARSRQHLLEVAKRVETLQRVERDSAGEAGRAQARGAASASQAADAGSRLGRATHELRDSCDIAATALTGAEASALPPPAAAAFASVPSWELPTDIDAAADALRSTGAAHATWVETARTAVGQVRRSGPGRRRGAARCGLGRTGCRVRTGDGR